MVNLTRTAVLLAGAVSRSSGPYNVARDLSDPTAGHYSNIR